MRTLLAGLVIVGAAFAQKPQIENARLEVKPFTGTMASEIAGLGAGPLWLGYAEPIIPGQRGAHEYGSMCWNDGNGDGGRSPDAPVRLEGPTALVVLARVENSRVDQLRVTSPDCRLDAGGLPFYWIDNVPAAASVAWLKTRPNDSAILAIALHADASAGAALDEMTAASSPENVREKAAFWLGQARGARGVARLKIMLASDPSEKVREKVVFALSQSHDPGGIPAVIDAARNNKDPRVRGQALFWLAQKAARQDATREAAARTISNAVENDPDRGVKEKAVFALQQMPNGEGVPMLIQVAKNNPDPDVRKRAMFWLGQSKDPRAVEFFEQVLKR